MYKVFNSKMVSTAFKRAALLGLAGAFLTTGFVVVYANINAVDLGSGDENIDLSINTFVDDSTVTTDNSSINLITAALGVLGDTPTGEEPSLTPYAPVRNQQFVDNYSYSFDMHETAPGDWVGGEQFRIRVYGYDAGGGPSATLITTLYADQAAALGGTEGVAVTVDMGLSSAIYDHFDIIIDRQ